MFEAAACGAAADVRRAHARRDPERAWACFERLRHLVAAHLEWERVELPDVLGLPGMMDEPVGVRPLHAWHAVMLDALRDVESALGEPDGGRADRGAARLAVLVEDYCADLADGLYFAIDEDVEARDAEPLRQYALDAWTLAMARARRVGG